MSDTAKKQVVLSLFPGADLFGKAFEELGFCVVHGPDKLWGWDVRTWHMPANRFDGIIGGPPCLAHTDCRNLRALRAEDMIGEYVRIVEEGKSQWAVMENVSKAKNSIYLPSSWIHHTVKDWDCGGLTKRKRTFWFYPQELGMSVVLPAKRAGAQAGAEYAVLASDGRRGKKGGWTHRGHHGLKIEEAARLQGFPNWKEGLLKPEFVNNRFGVHLLGNGVPRAMGLWVARNVLRWLERRK